ncbi:methyltransferase [Streptomyces physcomitrii]|uniref:methyltransferase n=1 Tax=Streptomyces physcomitrii TaxID=2724184 RepID=UPI0033E6416F
MTETSASRRLMELTVGYWASQAVHTAAELELADHLAEGPLTAPELTVRTGTHGPSLHRLLRFLTELGILRTDAQGAYLTTETGDLLRTREHGSMRDLALLYGEEFYSGWGALTHTVRTGERGFDSVHGAAMYPYFGRSPELTRKFDRAMAAGSEFFTQIPALYDFGSARTVVDIAGGNGVLLAEVLRSSPQARGVLFDTAHVIDAARRGLAGSDVADRLDFASGDYYEKVPAGGDVYLLSRILHGRDDEKCVEVLTRIRESIREDGALLIVERVIPDDGAPSLAVWFDVHMLTIAAGEERTRSEYTALLERSGFRLSETHELPLDTALLVAVPKAETGS